MLACLTLGLVIAFTALVQFWLANEHAWLKTVMQMWYVGACVLGIVSVFITVAFPVTTLYVKVVYNVAGQLISVTGIFDVLQLEYCSPRLLTLKDTNRMFLVRCLFGYALVLLGFLAAMAVHAVKGGVLLTYRCITLTFIMAETIAYLWTLVRRLGFSLGPPHLKARIYYAAAVCSRFGIIASVYINIFGVEKVVISMVHVTAVSFAIMTVALTGRISNLALRVKGTIVDAAKSHSLSRAGSSLKHDTPNPNAEPAGEDRSIPVGTQLNLNNVPILDGCTPTPMGCISAGIKNRQDQLLWNPRTISALKIAPHAATTRFTIEPSCDVETGT